MKKLINWIKMFWKKQEDKVEDVLDMQFLEPEKINLCPTCHKDFGCQCE